jgi:NAD(P)H-dependent FMN reductase
MAVKVCGIAGSLRQSSYDRSVAEAHKKFTDDGSLSDEQTGSFVRALLERLLAWVEGMHRSTDLAEVSGVALLQRERHA